MTSKAEKALLFLLSLDKTVAADVIRQLDEGELQALRAVAATDPRYDAAALDGIFKEFVEQSSAHVAFPHGDALEYLDTLEAAQQASEQTGMAPSGRGRGSPIARIEAARPEAVAALLIDETPQMIAAVLARLRSPAAAAIVETMPIELGRCVLSKMSALSSLPAGALSVVIAALAEELPLGEQDARVTVDGVEQAAEILNASKRSRAEAMLGRLAEREPEVAQRVRMAMVRFEHLARLDAQGIRKLLHDVPAERLTIALKGAEKTLRAAFLAGMSARAAQLLEQDIEALRGVRKSEIEAARLEVIQVALRLEADGTIDLGREGD